jgi:GT2 family glycosyltransferase
MTLQRTPWLKRALLSIRRYCPVAYSVKILSQGPPDKELIDFLKSLNDNRFELITSPINLGFGGGRRLLAELVRSPFTMMLDDDMYLTEGSIALALKVLQENESIGAVSMPLYDIAGHMIAQGGRNIVIRNGVIRRLPARLEFDANWVEVNDLSAGAMLYRTEMRRSFSWDPDAGHFEDLDKSLQIIRSDWKQAIVPKGRLIHDRSWLRTASNYQRVRLDGLSMRESYRFVRRKWGMRFDLLSHILYELVYPSLTLISCAWLSSLFAWFVQMRAIRRKVKY